MKAMQEAATSRLPHHVITAIHQAAGIASRRLKREAGINIGRDTLQAEGIMFAKRQAQESGGRHPAPEHGEFLSEVMAGVMVEWHST